MKKLLLFAFAVFAFAACTQSDVEELSANRADVPETLTVGFEGGDDTRIQLNEAQKTVWNKGDIVSVFYKSYDNLKFEFEGNTGDRNGTLKRVGGQHNGQTMDDVVVVYPYSADYMITLSEGCVNATIPSTQTYLKGSYGVGDNLMIANSSFNQFSLKSVCGWLKLQLTGDGETIKSITFRGNDDEQVAGLVYVDATTAEATLATAKHNSDDNSQLDGTLVLDDSIFTEVILDCGEGVALGKNATTFYIALPPQTFEKGFTIDVECNNGTSITKSTSEPITIERNHIKPMEAIEYDGVLPEVYELAYRTNDGNALDPLTTEGFGGEFEENIFDAATGEGKLVFAGAVTAIPDNAFGLCENLTWIEIPLGVTSIGASAFSRCSSMEEITIPASVTSVGSEAFKGCTGKAYINCSGVSFSGAGFAEVVIGDSVTTIGAYAFYECSSLTSITIPDSVTTIGNYAFYDCDSLTSVTIGDSVTTIGDFAFYDCFSLTSIAIPDSVTTIGGAAFSVCKSLTSVTIGDSVTTIGAAAFYDCRSLTGVTIPDSVTTIGAEAFYYCRSLTSITIPDSVTTIGAEAFYGCSSLTSVTIPDSVTTIGNYSFQYCNSLTSVYCEATLPPSLGGSSVFDNNASDRKIYVPEESVRQYKIAAGWSEYADYIVGNDFSTTSIINYTTSDDQIINARLPIISNTYSNGIGTIEFLGSIILERAFYDCDSLTSITIPDSVTTVGEKAFFECCSLTSVTIPDSVTTVGEAAFAFCYSLTEFNGKFASEDGRCLIVDGTLNSFAPAGLTSYTILDSVTTIGAEAFYGCDCLTSVTIPDSVTTIGDRAFAFCYSLTSITIPDSVTTIGEGAFYYCNSLTSITIPDSVTTIGYAAFCRCTSLTSVYCKATTPLSLGGRDVFDDNASDRLIYVPVESLDAYLNAEGWRDYADYIVGYDFENGVVVE